MDGGREDELWMWRWSSDGSWVRAGGTLMDDEPRVAGFWCGAWLLVVALLWCCSFCCDLEMRLPLLSRWWVTSA